MIIGGHGKVALLTAPLLVEAGHTVVSVFRNPAHTAEVEATGAQAVVADIEHLSTDQLAELFSDQDALVWSAGAGGGSPARTLCGRP
jgi:Trk K+ transport system NAD-binding subunit